MSVHTLEFMGWPERHILRPKPEYPCCGEGRANLHIILPDEKSVAVWFRECGHCKTKWVVLAERLDDSQWHVQWKPPGDSKDVRSALTS